MSQQPNITVRRLLNPTAEDIENAAKTVSEAFQAEPFTFTYAGGDTSLIYPLRKAGLEAAAIRNQIWVATCDGRDFAAVAVWFPPGRMPLEQEDEKEKMKDWYKTNSPELTRWRDEELMPAVNNLSKEAMGAEKDKAWYLQIMATHPDFHRRGLSRALLKPVFDQVREKGETLWLYTSTEINVQIYQRLGCEIAAGPRTIKTVGNDVMGGSFPAWVLKRSSTSEE